MTNRITRARWTQEERIDMLWIAKQLSSITPYVKAKHVRSLMETNRSDKAIYDELNRCKKASIGKWSDGDDNNNTTEKVNLRRIAWRYVGFPLFGPTELTRGQIITSPPEESREVTCRSRSNTDTDASIYLPQVKAKPETPAEKLFFLMSEDRYLSFGNYRNRKTILNNMAQNYWGRLSTKQIEMIEDLYNIYTSYHHS